MKALVCGSLAYDTIMVFPERFRDHILSDQIHILNVCFLTPKLRREFGGCAGNISYNLKLLGGEPLPMATVGVDFEPYREHLGRLGISDRYVRVIDGAYTAQAFITTDIDDNQITAFHPGAMEHSGSNQVRDVEKVDIGIVAPDANAAMRQHSIHFAERGIPHIFDPGQALPMFSADELLDFVDRADWITVNDYEGRLLAERTGLSPRDIACRTKAYIVTRGADGSEIHTPAGVTPIAPARAECLTDPTGCGDAYRGGLLWGLVQGFELADAARAGSLLGALKIARQGPQNHTCTTDQFHELFKENFGYRLE